MKKSEVSFSRLVESCKLSKPEAADLLGYDLSTIHDYCRGDRKPKKATIELLKRVAAERRPNIAGRGGNKFRFIDLFAGIGGMRLAAEAVEGRCVFTCERNAFSRQTYHANFPTDPEDFAEDIEHVIGAAVPDHDLLMAGFPCQPFSIAGVSKKNALGRPHGFECEEQGNLFFDIVRIIRAKQPAAFLLENVKNLRSHDGGTTFKVIMHHLQNELGYHVQSRVINAKGVVPQNRERIFILGFHSPVTFDFAKMQVPDPDRGPKLSAILHPEDGSEKADDRYTTGPDAKVAAKYVLTEHLWTYLQNYQAKHKALGHGFGFGLVGKDDTARTLSARYFKDGSEILIKRGRGRPRRLTPRECARLMGFDSGARQFVIPDAISDTQAYKQFGNAVVPLVVQSILKAALPHVLKVMKVMAANRQIAMPLDDAIRLRA